MSANERSNLDILSLPSSDDARLGLKRALRGCDPLSVLVRGAAELPDDALEILLLAAFSPEEISSIVDALLDREAPAPGSPAGAGLEEGLQQHRSSLDQLDALLGELPMGGGFAPLPEDEE